MVNLYEIEPANFYEQQAQSKNPVRKWFHQHRHELIQQMVWKYYHGGYIMDVGCGNCVWNKWKLPVIGVDGNAEALQIARQAGRLHGAIQADIAEFNVRAETFGLVVISEVLEHVIDYRGTLKSIYQGLEYGGHIIVTVPYDIPLSLWQPLFFAQCLYQGQVKGDDYYKAKCGHVHHFSPGEIARVLGFYGFRVVEQFNMRRFTIFTIGRKEALCEQVRDFMEVPHRDSQKVLLRGGATATAEHSRV